ncbi:MAG: radical SAM protein, partial [Spirochaetes bacterium]|nr:radical SAM protein [Spirochaetota bacterium]
MKKKVLLINTNFEKIPIPVPPLGLCTIANSIKEKYLYYIYDSVFDEGHNLKQIIDEYQPDYFGVGIRNVDNTSFAGSKYYLDTIYDKIIKTIHNYSHIPLILGGSGFSLFADDILALFQADYGVIGEGEKLFPYLLDCLENNIKPHHPNIIGKNMTKQPFKIATTFDVSTSLHSKIDEKINFFPYLERSVYSIQTKRGCHHQCIYCTYPLLEGKKYRLRDPKDIANEIAEAHYRSGITNFEFVDSTFNDPADHAEEICREIIKKKINIRLRTMGINPQNSSYQLFELMKKAGFFQINCTPDTASNKMLINMKKNFNQAKLIDLAKMIIETEMPTMWFFIFGGPGETKDTVLETMEFINQHIHKLDMAHITIGLRIYPGADIEKTALSEGIIQPGQSLLKPVFYFSPEISLSELKSMIRDNAQKYPNFIPSDESTPPPNLLKLAMDLKKSKSLTEPMFRILLRMRYKLMGNSEFVD